MAQEAIAVLGNPPNGWAAMESLLAEFEWSVENTLSVDGLAEICARRDVVAVLIDPAVLELPWKRVLAAVQAVAPRTLAILCYHFASPIDWSEASAAGAFHMLSLPLDPGELRQSLGFVWAEKNKRSHVIPLTGEERSRARGNTKRGAGGANAAAHVA